MKWKLSAKYYELTAAFTRGEVFGVYKYGAV